MPAVHTESLAGHMARHAHGCRLQLGFRATGYWLVNDAIMMLNDARGQYIDYGQLPPVAVAREWTRAPLNYDNVAISLLTLFTVQTRDNWPTYVHHLAITLRYKRA